MEAGRTEAEADNHLMRYGTEFFPILVGMSRVVMPCLETLT
jgi:hypothetical protein